MMVRHSKSETGLMLTQDGHALSRYACRVFCFKEHHSCNLFIEALNFPKRAFLLRRIFVCHAFKPLDCQGESGRRRTSHGFSTNAEDNFLISKIQIPSCP